MQTKDYFITRWEKEIGLTLNAFRDIPAENAGYRPHPKARSAQQLVDHITAHAHDIIQGLEGTDVNHDVFLTHSSVSEACDSLAAASQKLLFLLNRTDEGTWTNKILPISAAGYKMYDLTLQDFCFNWMFDIIHHRGQLSTYYRAMGTLPPFIYGPNAEQTEAMFAKAAAS